MKAQWDWEVDSKTFSWKLGLKELWSYRYLSISLIKRDFLVNYQQTILGPLWLLFQPLITLVTYVVVFGTMVGIPTGTIPPVLFYFSGIILWNLFHDIFNGTSTVFRDNAYIFSKVYFPRMIMPIAAVSTHFIRFSIQLVSLLCLIAYYVLFQGLQLTPQTWLLALPLAIIFVGVMSLGLGLIFSVITVKYRDLTNLVAVCIRMLMFVTPVIYPTASVPEKVRWIVEINPLAPLFEILRLSLLGEGTVNPMQVLYSITFSIAVLGLAIFLFHKQGAKLIDIV